MVRMWVANTDPDWFDYLASQPEIDEVNFWQPSGSTQFGAIRPTVPAAPAMSNPARSTYPPGEA